MVHVNFGTRDRTNMSTTLTKNTNVKSSPSAAGAIWTEVARRAGGG